MSDDVKAMGCGRRMGLALLGTAAAAILIGLLLGAGGAGYYNAKGPALCAHCHEIQPAYESWKQSSHRDISCDNCHGGLFTFDWRVHLQHAHELVAHWRGDFDEPVRLSFDMVMPTQERCIACHQQEGADWRAGPHSASFARIFPGAPDAHSRPLTDECLRCHGMHFEGGIDELITPVNRDGAARLSNSRLEVLSAIPCLTCHQIHTTGMPLPAYAPDTRSEEIARPSLAFYDHETRTHTPLESLSLPELREGSRRVMISPDPRQKLCYQCHAPAPELPMQAGSGDDRTCVGLHEGISCLTCHQKHRQTTRASCDGCHPKFSLGGDVKEMDTTFRDPDSAYDIHTLKME